jgi:protein-S-isoprenylcysteine O-methyltransferase
VRTLGRAFVTETRGVDVDDESTRLVETGVYAWLRHPSEAGNFAVALGACLLLGSGAAAVVVAAGVVPFTLLRLRREDVGLERAHGVQFRRYARRVKGLVPGVA